MRLIIARQNERMARQDEKHENEKKEMRLIIARQDEKHENEKKEMRLIIARQNERMARQDEKIARQDETSNSFVLFLFLTS
jgi:hypothetical protein